MKNKAASLVLTDTAFARILLLPCYQNYRPHQCCQMITRSRDTLRAGKVTIRQSTWAQISDPQDYISEQDQKGYMVVAILILE